MIPKESVPNSPAPQSACSSSAEPSQNKACGRVPELPCGRLCVCSPSSLLLDQQGCAESAFRCSSDTTRSLPRIPGPGRGPPKMCFAGQFLLKQFGAGLSVCSFHQKLVVFNYLLPISLLIFLLGSLTDSVAINDYICLFTHQCALPVKAVCPAHVTMAIEPLSISLCY